MKTSVFTSIILCLVVFCTPALSAIIYVDADAPGTNNGTSWTNAYTDLPSALSAAGSGDQIRAAVGTYKPTTGTDRTVSFQLKNNVVLNGGYAGYGQPDPDARDVELYKTILSADIGTTGNNSDNSYHVFYHPTGTNLNSSAVLNGVTITAGNANGAGDKRNGGGMFNEDSAGPTVTNCTFVSNSASSNGGGMYNESASPAVTSCTFTDNEGIFGGGGIYNYQSSSPAVTSCTFTDNKSTFGGAGIYNYQSSSPAVTSCTFTDNIAGSSGGAIYNNDLSEPNVIDCNFTGNDHGGIYNNDSSSPLIANCTFTDNDSYGIENNSSSSPRIRNCTFTANGSYGIENYSSSNAAITNCTFTGHLGGAIYNSSSSPVITNCTLTGNRGHGMRSYSASTPTITNCIIWNNLDTQIYSYSGAVPTVTYSDVQDGYPGTGNIDQDPLFANAADDDYNLQFNSPCIDTGDDSAVPAGITTDIDGGPRISNAAVDMGAQEQNIVFVDHDAPGSNNGTSWYNAYNDIQNALMMVDYNDQIRVAGGTYKPGSARTDSFQLLNTVGLNGGYAGYGQPDPDAYDIQLYETILSADIGTPDDNSDNCYHVFYHPLGTDLDSTAVLSGVTITAANADSSSPHCHGGGMYNYSSSPTLTNCTFTDNAADSYGGGIYNYSASSGAVIGCTFTANTANYAGGMYNSASDPTVVDCNFSANVANSYGGAIYNFAASVPTILNSIFIDNSANRGAAIYNNSSAVIVLNSEFINNEAGDSGGGIYNSAFSNSTITNCAFSANAADNVGGGMFNYSSSPTITNCSFSYNTAEGSCGGIYNYGSSNPAITNCILWYGTDPQIENYNGSPVVTYSNIELGYPGAGNVDTPPFFAKLNGPDGTLGTADDNLRLRYDSPCIDAGNNYAYTLGAMLDCDMMPRIVDDPITVDTGQAFPSFPVIDMGAYEYRGPTPIEGDIDGDGDVDFDDFALMAGNWLEGTD